MNQNRHNSDTERQCIICKEIKPLNRENFHADKSRVGGFMYGCKPCEKIRTAEKYAKNPRLDRWKNTSPEAKAQRIKVARIYFKTPKGRSIQLSKAYQQFDKKRGYENDIDQYFIINNIFGKPCTYCGALDENMGCDRINNSIGHTQKNVIPACGICNVTRQNNFTVEEMKKIGKVIAEIRLSRTTI